VLLAGAMTGLYFAFSASVMPALDALPPKTAIAAMRAINRKIQNSVFFVAFFGAPVAAVVSGALLFALEREIPGAAMLGAAAVYLLGSLLPTVFVNVPLNLRLERGGEPAEDAGAAAIWRDFSRPWTRWNTLRGIFTAASLLLAALALFWRGWAESLVS
jgi:uncharacterized membrane protein